MTAARPFPLVPALLVALVAFAAAFGIGLAAKKSSSGPAALPKAPVVALPSQTPKVAALQTGAAVPALRAAARKHHAKKPASSGNATAQATAPAQSAPTQSAPVQSAPRQTAPAPAPAPKKTGGGSTGGGVVGGGTQ